MVSTANFAKVAERKDLAEGQMKLVELGEEQVCLANIKDNYYAIGNVCTHEQGPLNEGTLDGYEVECPWHQARFDVRSGEVLSPPAETPVPSYEVKVQGNDILIRRKN